MPGTYARKTDVPVNRSFEEIRRTLQRFGADGFGYVEMGNRAGIQFQVNQLRVKMTMDLPERERFATDTQGNRRPEAVIDREWEQACRQRWRTAANGIKAKLALVDDGLSTVEREFLADIMLPSGATVGELIHTGLVEAIGRTEMPPLMPGMVPTADETPTADLHLPGVAQTNGAMTSSVASAEHANQRNRELAQEMGEETPALWPLLLLLAVAFLLSLAALTPLAR
jgi:hypothetical protein